MPLYNVAAQKEVSCPDQIDDPDLTNVRLAAKACIMHLIETQGGDSPSKEAWLVDEIFQALYGPNYALLFKKFPTPD